MTILGKGITASKKHISVVNGALQAVVLLLAPSTGLPGYLIHIKDISLIPLKIVRPAGNHFQVLRCKTIQRGKSDSTMQSTVELTKPISQTSMVLGFLQWHESDSVAGCAGRTVGSKLLCLEERWQLYLPAELGSSALNYFAIKMISGGCRKHSSARLRE